MLTPDLSAQPDNAPALSAHPFSLHVSTAWLQPVVDAMPGQAILAINRRAKKLLQTAAVQRLFTVAGAASWVTPAQDIPLPKAMRQALVVAMRQRQPLVTLTLELPGLQRRLHCRLFYPRQRRHAVGLWLEEAESNTLQQLKQMHGMVQSLLESSADMICIKDTDQRWIAANQTMLDSLGLSDDDYPLTSTTQLLSQVVPAMRPHLKQQISHDAQSRQSGSHLQHEEMLTMADGRQKTLQVRNLVKPDQGQVPGYILTVARDTSDLHALQQDLQQRNAMLDTLISSDWLLHSAAHWQQVVEQVLQQCCLSFHFDRAVLLQHRYQQGRQKKDMRSQTLCKWSANGSHASAEQWEKVSFSSPHLQRWQQLLAEGQPVLCDATTLPDAEKRLLKPQQVQTIVMVPLMLNNQWWGSLVFERQLANSDTSSQALGSLMAIGRTLSVAIDREQTGRHLNLAKIAFDSTTEGMMIVNPAGELIGINQGYSLITGYDEAEVLGQKPAIFRQRPNGFLSALKRRGKWSGELENYRKNGEKYTEWLTLTAVKNADQHITNYVGVFADITDIKRSQQQLNVLVNHDPLTGLPNRRLIQQLFNHALQLASRNQTQAAVLFIDLDRFKNINDSLGHMAGDRLLLEVSTRIRAALRESDILGRQGGDEFIVLLENLRDKEDAAVKAQAILTTLKREFYLDQHELFIGASIGIAMYPADGQDVESLIKAADLAMYQVKNNGKNHHAFYFPTLSQHAVEHFHLENELRQALAKQQLRLFYQPQIDLQSGMVVGAEALIRWQHPTQGLVPPGRFIPLAEESGLILSIGQWALKEAVSQAQQWQQTFQGFKKMAINVSAMQIMQSQFADTVYGTLLETDCDADLIELEITESTLMQHTEHVVNTFHQLKQLGVSIAIDDFGTGYSSLSHLKRLPLDQLKIDRSFVKDLPDDKDDAAITNAIYAMATQLGFTVVAEGVETQEQEQFLKHMGCQTAQGFLYSYPLPEQDFVQLMQIRNQQQVKRHA